MVIITKKELEIIKLMLNFRPDIYIEKYNNPSLKLEEGWFTVEMLEKINKNQLPFSRQTAWNYLDKSLTQKKKILIQKDLEYKDRIGRKFKLKAYKVNIKEKVYNILNALIEEKEFVKTNYAQLSFDSEYVKEKMEEHFYMAELYAQISNFDEDKINEIKNIAKVISKMALTITDKNGNLK